MRVFSWKIVATLAAVLILAPARPGRADDPPKDKNTTTTVSQVRLDLYIAGLQQDCTVEIKPAHLGCGFEPITRRIEAKNARLSLPPIEVKTASADRDCTFAITIKEPGQRPQTFRRGLRLNPSVAGRPPAVQNLTCYLSSPSQIASGEREDATKARPK